jgi:hypothetical protein
MKTHHEFVQLQRLQRRDDLNPSSLGESPFSSLSADNEEESLVGFIEPSGSLSRAIWTSLRDTHRLNSSIELRIQWNLGKATIAFPAPIASGRPDMSP